MKRMVLKKLIASVTLAAFVLTGAAPVDAADMVMPAPGAMAGLSPAFQPPVLAGVKVYASEPLRMDFILDNGDFAGTGRDRSLQDETTRLIKYFLAALTVPEKDLWVNLSPYEKDRIVPEAFGQTAMGRDLLAQDYLLKQITASLIYPEGETGKKFWAEVYKQAQEKSGTTDIPMDTFNKVWITPDTAVVYEKSRADGAVAYVNESRLKVMLESDYLATQAGADDVPEGARHAVPVQTEILRTIIIPLLEKEVNEGANFAALRQVYRALILAAWYKKKIVAAIHGSPLQQAYVDKNKIAGVNIADPKEAGKIWGQYAAAFEKGAFNYIKEEQDGPSGELVARKYFSGGIDCSRFSALTLKTFSNAAQVSAPAGSRLVEVPAKFLPAADTGALVMPRRAGVLVAGRDDGAVIRRVERLPAGKRAALLKAVERAGEASGLNKPFWETEKTWNAWIAQGDPLWLLQSRDGQVQGVLSFDYRERDSVYIDSLVTTTTQSGSGYGSFLLDTLFSELQREGVRRVSWHSYAPARDFYRNYLEGYTDRQGKAVPPRVGNGVIAADDSFNDDFRVTLKPGKARRRDAILMPNGATIEGVTPEQWAVLAQAPGGAQWAIKGGVIRKADFGEAWLSFYRTPLETIQARLQFKAVEAVYWQAKALIERTSGPRTLTIVDSGTGDGNGLYEMMFEILQHGKLMHYLEANGVMLRFAGFGNVFVPQWKEIPVHWQGREEEWAALAARVTFVLGEAEDFQNIFKPGSINILVDHYGPLSHTTDPRENAEYIRRIAPVLAPGAKVFYMYGPMHGGDAEGFADGIKSVLPAGGFQVVTKTVPDETKILSVTLSKGSTARHRKAGGRLAGVPKGAKATGGIDLTEGRMNVATQGDGESVVFRFDPDRLQALRAATGLVPSVTGVRPLKDLAAFLKMEAPS